MKHLNLLPGPARLADLGLFPAATIPAQFGQTIREEIEKNCTVWRNKPEFQSSQTR